jgi:hypothetical protein
VLRQTPLVYGIENPLAQAKSTINGKAFQWVGALFYGFVIESKMG